MIDDLTGAISIEIPADNPARVETTPTPKVEAGDKSAGKDDVFASLKQQVEDERQKTAAERAARERAEEMARESYAARTRAEQQVETSHASSLEATLVAAQTRLDAAERDYAAFAAAGDWAAAAKAQRAMAEEAARVDRLQDGKKELRTTEGRVVAPQTPPTVPPRHVDPIEDMASRLTPQSQAWVRANPTVVSNPRKLAALHNAAIDIEGLKAESPEYFQYLEKGMGLSREADRSAHPERRTPSSPVASAPAGGTRGAANRNVVTLSPSEREHARMFFPDKSAAEAETQYAINKAALIAEGKLTA